MRSVVLLSGGMDSTTALAMARREGPVIPLSIRYGSTHQVREGNAATRVAEWYGLSQEIVRIELPKEIFAGGTSALLGYDNIPNEEYHDIEKETPSVTVVPFRNALLISVATAIAESRGYDHVWAAVHGTDAAGWAYPDCTPEFTGAMANAIYVGTLHKVRLATPFSWATKSDIVKLAVQLEAPMHLTYSCYRGRQLHCGVCPTCLERIKAFSEAGYIDPVHYETEPIWADGLKEYPDV